MVIILKMIEGSECSSKLEALSRRSVFVSRESCASAERAMNMIARDTANRRSMKVQWTALVQSMCRHV